MPRSSRIQKEVIDTLDLLSTELTTSRDQWLGQKEKLIAIQLRDMDNAHLGALIRSHFVDTFLHTGWDGLDREAILTYFTELLRFGHVSR